MKADQVMQEVVARLVEQMEQGADAWEMPWRKIADGGFPTNATTGAEYKGGNVLVLAYIGAAKGYSSSKWATYKQWASVDATVRAGEKGTHLVFWSPIAGGAPTSITVKDEQTGDDVTLHSLRSSRGFYKGFVVFNREQVDNAPVEPDKVELTQLERDERAERFFAGIGGEVVWGGNRAYYSPSTDTVHMPQFDQFDASEHAYATLAHEYTHWTGNETRLARVFGKRFGDNEYAAEELVAELGAAFTCARIGIDTVARTDHAAYLKNWCGMLKESPALLWTVASKAQAACDFLVKEAGWVAEGAEVTAELVDA